MESLATLLNARNVQIEMSAAKELLDRGFGRPAQVVTGEGDGVAIGVIHRVIVGPPAEQPMRVVNGEAPAPVLVELPEQQECDMEEKD